MNQGINFWFSKAHIGSHYIKSEAKEFTRCSSIVPAAAAAARADDLLLQLRAAHDGAPKWTCCSGERQKGLNICNKMKLGAPLLSPPCGRLPCHVCRGRQPSSHPVWGRRTSAARSPGRGGCRPAAGWGRGSLVPSRGQREYSSQTECEQM